MGARHSNNCTQEIQKSDLFEALLRRISTNEILQQIVRQAGSSFSLDGTGVTKLDSGAVRCQSRLGPRFCR